MWFSGSQLGRKKPLRLGAETSGCGRRMVRARSLPRALIWEPSEAMRQGFPYAPIRDPGTMVGRLARLEPELLACMHGSTWKGDGAALLRKLEGRLSG